ncbi:actin cortical patch SUR7/pH-response regulator pali [Pseudomassariella vexata]|uniref:Actin cortical patch SUR7/pH-response regulator pali n=1 Tax=Pseudomassariella vexata TaxID=1141098 RepID=A0A1Y2DJT0_9PEZI|nr:actin cortical patch SUR7/pH-response regulator pali [Pseudomassariella vexata]ORY59507.1 actin cortical patch SUR7/pH-response regulator pali [Pseudomassariella vexata]
MGQTGFFHHIGSFLLLVATILLIVTCISAPVVNDLSMLKVMLKNGADSKHPSITFGTFGYCVKNQLASGDSCTRSAIGYDASHALTEAAGGSGFELSDYASKTSNALTKVMILHPIACGMSFIAFLLALGAGVVGSFLAAMVAALTFLVTLVVLITDFVSFSILKSAVNNSDTGAYAEFGAASWTILVSAVCNLLATIVVFVTCCSARMHKRKRRSAKADSWENPPAGVPGRRRWF